MARRSRHLTFDPDPIPAARLVTRLSATCRHWPPGRSALPRFSLSVESRHMNPTYRLSALLPALLLAACAPNASKLGQKIGVVPGVMEGYQEFLQARSGGSGAFAVSLSGNRYAYYYCPAQRCVGGRSAAAPRAIQACEKTGETCVLFATDEGIIAPYEVVP
jgi:hypothetical protein